MGGGGVGGWVVVGMVEWVVVGGGGRGGMVGWVGVGGEVGSGG